MNIKQAFPSKYLRSQDLGSTDHIVTIKRVAIEEMGEKSGIRQNKPIVYFYEFDKGFACNKTNSNTIAKLYGDETTAWTGKKIILWVKPDVEFQGEMGPAIRVRPTAPGNGIPKNQEGMKMGQVYQDTEAFSSDEICTVATEKRIKNRIEMFKYPQVNLTGFLESKGKRDITNLTMAEATELMFSIDAFAKEILDA